VTAKAQQQERAMDRLRLLLEASEKRVLSLLASGLYFCTSKASKVRTSAPTPPPPSRGVGETGAQFTCFTSTKVQMLTTEELLLQAEEAQLSALIH
jgi:hypothetical protein